MPGLKKDLGHITGMMEEAPTTPQKQDIARDKMAKTEVLPLYAETFNKKMGAGARARYDAGNPPRLHRLLFEAIEYALDGEKRGHVNLAPIIENLGTSRGVCTKILSCLEAYGYLRITRDGKGPGKTLIFEICRNMP